MGMTKHADVELDDTSFDPLTAAGLDVRSRATKVARIFDPLGMLTLGIGAVAALGSEIDLVDDVKAASRVEQNPSTRPCGAFRRHRTRSGGLPALLLAQPDAAYVSATAVTTMDRRPFTNRHRRKIHRRLQRF